MAGKMRTRSVCEVRICVLVGHGALLTRNDSSLRTRFGYNAGMNETDLTELVRLTEQAAALMRDADRTHLGVEQKTGNRDLVTHYDKLVQETLVETLGRAFPGVGFQCEEGGEFAQTTGTRFIIDPIDGTSNFVHGMGLSATSVALVEDDTPLAAVVANPFSDETFSAAAGRGAAKCGAALPPVADAGLADSLVCLGTSLYFPELYQKTLDLVARLGLQFNDIRRLGSAALDCCFAAEGRYGVFFEYTLAPWDYAAGSLIAAECGAHVSTMENAPLRYDARCSVLIGAPRAAEEFLALL